MRWPHPVEAEMHITAELNRSGTDYLPSGRSNFKLNCPFPHPKGSDAGMNLEIMKDGRKAHCWVCNWSGSWNKLAAAMGLTPFGQDVDPNTFTDRGLKNNLFERLGQEFSLLVEEDARSGKLPYGYAPWDRGAWRGFSSDFLASFPSYFWKQRITSDSGEIQSVDRILWPYYQYDRLVGWCGRRLDKSKEKKYFRAPWCYARNVLFPFDYIRRTHADLGYVVLVEGEVDALRLISYGIPTLAILGSNSWSDYKIDLLLSLEPSRVFILLDPDGAGQKAADYIESQIKDHFDLVKKIRIAGDDDPGSLDESQLSWLKARIASWRK